MAMNTWKCGDTIMIDEAKFKDYISNPKRMDKLKKVVSYCAKEINNKDFQNALNAVEDFMSSHDDIPSIITAFILSDIPILNTIRAIYNEYCLFAVPYITGIKLPENIETLGAEAFYACENCRDIWIPKSLKDIKLSRFYSMALKNKHQLIIYVPKKEWKEELDKQLKSSAGLFDWIKGVELY